MTDNEIIKALKCCIDADCINCPRWTKEWYSGMCSDFLPSLLDLINRQKAEIESLNEQERILICQLAEEREKAVKEFAERLKAKAKGEFKCCTKWVDEDDIDNLVKEMIGE